MYIILLPCSTKWFIGGDCMTIRFYRMKAGLTQVELADRLGLTKQSVWRWEKGERQPDIATAKRIAAILCCSLDNLFADENPTQSRAVEPRRMSAPPPGTAFVMAKMRATQPALVPLSFCKNELSYNHLQ